ncbi:MAG: hypothetical protein QW175_02945 [Candidatus Bathyarchaeia archaeon]
MNIGKRTLSLTLTSLLIMATMLIVTCTPLVSGDSVSQFTATITPSLAQSSKSYNFNVTIKNLASSTGLGVINITYPAGWIFNAIVNYGGSRPWSAVHDESAKTFKLWGPNLLVGESVWILVNMTTQLSTADPVNWLATAWDISGTLLGTCNLPVTVDGQAPTVAISAPASGTNYYSVGAGRRIWINGTVSDDLNITKYGLTLAINDTRFERIVYTRQGDSHTTYNFAFANKTAIPDGKLAIKVTAKDASGRTNSAERQTTIDNTAPGPVYVKVLDQDDNELPFVSNVYWMGAGTTGIKVKAAFYNPATPINGRIYLNSTYYTFENETATSPAFNVIGSNYVVLKITLVDSATPIKNNFTRTWEIRRDEEKPSAPTFTVQPICGGAIIRALTATDNVGVLSFKVYINGTPVDVPLAKLQAKKLTSVGSHRTFEGVLVLSLADCAGKTANITIKAVDCGANEGPGLPTPEPPALPTTYHLPAGWCLAGFTETTNMAADAYLGSLEPASYFRWLYVWNAPTQSWIMVDTKSGQAGTLNPGQAFWIYLYKDQDLIPPIPS